MYKFGRGTFSAKKPAEFREVVVSEVRPARAASRGVSAAPAMSVGWLIVGPDHKFVCSLCFRLQQARQLKFNSVLISVLVEWPNVIGVCLEHVQGIHGRVGTDIELVVIGAGSPCQDLTGLNATDQGLKGSRSCLVVGVPGIMRMFGSVFGRHKVKWLLENVPPM